MLGVISEMDYIKTGGRKYLFKLFPVTRVSRRSASFFIFNLIVRSVLLIKDKVYLKTPRLTVYLRNYSEIWTFP